MTSLTAKDVRIPPEIFSEVAYRNERVKVTRHGRETVYIVSAEDVELLEMLEDYLDLREVEKAIADIGSGKERTIPWETVKKKAGL